MSDLLVAGEVIVLTGFSTVIGYWWGLSRERRLQSEARLQFMRSPQYAALSFDQRIGAAALWEWLQEKS